MPKRSSVKTVANAVSKRLGAHIVHSASDIPSPRRAPTGLVELDYILGGGLPRGRMTEIYGMESSGKTALSLCAIRENQKYNPDEDNVFIDTEGTFDTKWAQHLGVNTDELLLVTPDNAEQVVDLVEGFIDTDNLGILVLDSMAALITAHEIKSVAEKTIVAGTSMICSKLVKRACKCLQDAQLEKRFPVFLCLNQIRMKINVMYGNPETTPGGLAPKFFSSLRLRLHGKDEPHPDDSNVTYAKTITATVTKAKFEVIAKKSETKLLLKDYGGLNAGMVDCWPFIKKYAVRDKLLVKQGTDWRFCGEVYPNQLTIKKKIYTDPQFKLDVISKLVAQSETINLPSDGVKSVGA